jgi:hypothetical protein
MIEIIALLITNFCLIAFLGYIIYSYNKERKELIRSILAKNLQELTDAELTDKFKPNAQENKKPELIPVSDLSETDFDKMIKKQLEQASK